VRKRSHRRRHDDRPRVKTVDWPPDRCTRDRGKLIYVTQADAAGHVAALRVANGGRERVKVYRCPYFVHWHVGHG
jgi:hypothetical protein